MIIILVTIATSLVAYSDSAAMFPFSFRIPLNPEDAKDVSSVIMVPAVGPIASDSQILRSLFDGFSFWAASQAVKVDPSGASSSTSVTSSLVSSDPTPADKPVEQPVEQPAEQSKEKSVEQPVVQPAEQPAEAVVADDAKTSELAASEPQVTKSDDAQSADEVPTSDPALSALTEAVIADDAKTSESAASEPEVTKSDDAEAVEVPASDPAPSTLSEAVIADDAKTSEPAAAEPEVKKSDAAVTSDDAQAVEVPTSDAAPSALTEAIVADDAKTSEPAAAEPEVTRSDDAQAVEVPASDAAPSMLARAVIADDAKTNESTATNSEVTGSDATVTSDDAQPAVENFASEVASTDTAPVADAPATEQPQAASDKAESVVESTAELAAEPAAASPVVAPESEVEMDSVTEHTADAVIINAPEEPVSEANEADESSALISFTDLDARQITPTTPNPYSLTCGYLPGFNFSGYDMYTRTCPDPFTCGNILCSGDNQCTHWTWIPPTIPGGIGTCFLKNRPGSDFTWATPSTTIGTYCGFIPKRACPPALISICIYIDITIQLPFISALIG